MSEAIANQLVPSDEIEWQPLPEPGVTGVFVKVLQFDESARSIHRTHHTPTLIQSPRWFGQLTAS